MKKLTLALVSVLFMVGPVMGAEYFWEGQEGGNTWEAAEGDTANEVCQDLEERANAGNIEPELFTDNCSNVPDVDIDRDLLLNMIYVSQEIDVSDSYTNGLLSSISCFQDNDEESINARDCDPNFIANISVAIDTADEESSYISEDVVLETSIQGGQTEESTESDSESSSEDSEGSEGTEGTATGEIESGFYSISNVGTDRELEVKAPDEETLNDQGTDIQTWETGGDPNDNQIWYVNDDSDWLEDDGYVFINYASNKVMEVGGGSTSDGPEEGNVQQWFWNGNSFQRFSLSEVNNGEYAIKPRHLDGRSIAVNNDDNRATVFQTTYNGEDTQLWSFNEVEIDGSIEPDERNTNQDDTGSDTQEDSDSTNDESSDTSDEELSASDISWEFMWRPTGDENEWRSSNTIPDSADNQDNDVVDLRLKATTPEDGPTLTGYNFYMDIENQNSDTVDDPNPQNHICGGDEHECYGYVGGRMTQDLNAGGWFGDSTTFEVIGAVQEEQGDSSQDIERHTLTFESVNGEQ